MELQAYTAFEALVADVQSCRLCSEMDGCTRVLSWANGPAEAKIMFIGEAPGRLGADRTSVPFHGDKAGDNFEHLIDLAGLSRRDLFITNAILCNPRDERGNNAPPSKRSIRNCSSNLQRQIETIDPAIVVTLGAAALEATRQIDPHELTLSGSVRSAHAWNGRLIIPLYHPGARAMVHRNFAAQTADYYFVGETYRRLGRKRRAIPDIGKPNSVGWDVVRFLLGEFGSCSLFKLHKAMYLTDWRAVSEIGHRATDFVYLRQKDGPYCVELGSRWYKRFSNEIALHKTNDQLVIEWRGDGLFGSQQAKLASDLVDVAARVAVETRNLSDGQLKTKSYLTKPMKDYLRAERAGHSQLNRPLL
ncbi:MAG: uracil-DNA glycosylase [Sphingomonas sp.]